MEIHIREGSIPEVVTLSKQIPEFFEPYPEKVYEERLSGVPHLILIATVDGKSVGFKVGYRKFGQVVFYSWMGGVLNEYRRMGIATKLADQQEAWAKANGFCKITFKTRNHLINMIHFGLKRGFIISDLIKNGEIKDHRIVMEKFL